ncbi:MAG: hypothetical protein K2M27_12165 [Muribaculaceae bacterium]|nr:hypothetical protein [Muribaculaceae bacterium]
MKRILIYVATIFLVSTVTSCGSGKPGQETEELVSEIFINGDALAAPSFMAAAGEGLLVTNSYKCDTLLNYYDGNGKPAGTFLPKGEGDKEALWLSTVQYDSKTGDAYCSDIDKKVLFRISGIGKGESMVEREMSRPVSDGDTIENTGEFMKFKNFYLAYNASPAGMLSVYTPDGVLLGTRVPYPDKSLVDDGLTEWANIHLYQPSLSVNDRGDFGVVSFFSSGRIVLISDKDGRPDFKIIEGEAPNNIFLVESGADFVQGAFTKDSKTHSISSSAGMDHAYVLYSGLTDEVLKETDYCKETKLSASRDVKVYDREGEEVRKLRLDRWVHQIAVSSDEKWLYALTHTPEEGFIIVRYAL